MFPAEWGDDRRIVCTRQDTGDVMHFSERRASGCVNGPVPEYYIARLPVTLV